MVDAMVDNEVAMQEGGKQKKRRGNNHKLSCGCPICQNMRKKTGGQQEGQGEGEEEMYGGRRRRYKKRGGQQEGEGEVEGEDETELDINETVEEEPIKEMDGGKRRRKRTRKNSRRTKKGGKHTRRHSRHRRSRRRN